LAGCGFIRDFASAIHLIEVDESIIQQVIRGAVAENRIALSEIESKRILEALGISTAMPYAARSADEAAALAARCGFPVVLKVLSPDVTHKSDVGGVALGLRSEAEVREAFSRIRRDLAAHAPKARFEGVAVQAMAQPGLEMLAGITRDPQFGALVMVGMGGVLVEVLKDTAVRIAPIGEAEALAMLAELGGAALLKGTRGMPPADQSALASLLAKISAFAVRHPEIREMDLNPVVAYRDGLCALDARILLERVEGAGRIDPELRGRRLANLARAIKPRTVAVIGDRGVREYMWLHTQDHFKGKRYSVQPDPREAAGIEALGVPNFKTVAEVPEPIDYAIVTVPRQSAPQVLADCIKAKAAGIGFFTAGFSEVGDELGNKLEQELRALACESDIALVGPNCMGLCNPGLGLLNSSGLRPAPSGGDVCFISQSGTHAVSFVMKAPGRGIKVNLAASIGNAIVLEATEYLDVMAADPATRAIGIYLEGVRDGRRLFESLRSAAARHPVLIWKGGVTESGARATFSHTGSLATPAAVWKAVVRQSGAAEVINLEAMLDAMELLTRTREVRGRGMALVAMTGGQSVVISDAFARHGLEVPPLSDSTYQQFSTFFKVIGGSYRNPLDAAWTMGHAGSEGNVDRVLDILDQDPVIDAIVMELRPGPGFGRARREIKEEDLTPMIDRLAGFDRRAKKPFAVVIESGHIPPESESWVVGKAEELARARGLVAFVGFERAAAAFRAAAECYENRRRLAH
jgi:acetate---CoA ligase (ADP-forming) subunit alpha